MFTWLGQTQPSRTQSPASRRTVLRVESLDERCLPSAQTTPVFVQTNLVSDVSGMANTTDPLLINPWGVSFSGNSPFWVSNNNSGTSTLYDGQGNPQPPGTTPPTSPLQVTIPVATGGTPPGSPTGTVFNTDPNGAFNVSETVGGVMKTGSSIFLFATEDGTISGWSPGVDQTHAIVGVTVPGADFTGLAIGTDAAGQTLIYAADIANHKIDVFNDSFQQVTTLAGKFTDRGLPAGADPFNIQNIGGKLYVEYTTSSSTMHGAVDVFTTDGKPVNPGHPLITGGVLDSPWGVAMAPHNFKQFSNDLLVGNFGDGHINAFNPTTGAFVGTLTLTNGKPFQEDDLWTLTFGNGTVSSANTLYFTAGINNEKDGLFGSLQATSGSLKGGSVLASLPATAEQIISTVPGNGDVNPYGLAFVPLGFQSGTGPLHQGDLLVSNFNNSTNTQGTGTTIVRITPTGQQSVFFQGSAGLGLTTALGVLKNGFVVVGNVPTDASGAAQQGSLLILDAAGNVVTTLTDPNLLNGPWDLAVNDQGNTAQLFVANVLSGTVTRINLSVPVGGTPKVLSKTQIASGYLTRTDPAALVVGPTGLAYNSSTDTLYVAATGNNAIYAVHSASVAHRSHGLGQLIYNHASRLHGPLGLVLAPNGNLILANGDAVNPNANQPNEMVEITPQGQFAGQFQVDPGAPGGAFGVTATSRHGVIRFVAVDDVTNTVDIWTML
jgi:uncharacterized protein (TIGR03118 family)